MQVTKFQLPKPKHHLSTPEWHVLQEMIISYEDNMNEIGYTDAVVDALQGSLTARQVSKCFTTLSRKFGITMGGTGWRNRWGRPYRLFWFKDNKPPQLT